MQRISKFSIAVAMCLSACGVGGSSDAITVKVTITGDGVDRARIINDPTTQPDPDRNREPGDPVPPPPDPYGFEQDGEVVDLPWSTTITIDRSDGRRQDFDLIAINESDAGTLSCNADFEQADGPGSWGRSNSFIAGCSGDVSFSDGADVSLEPGGRSTSFETRDERRAEIAAEIEAEAERVSSVATAQSDALAPGATVEVAGWAITPTGANRDAADVLVAHNQTNSFSVRERAVLVELSVERIGPEPGRLSNITADIVGGFDLALSGHDDDRADCGVIPDSWHNLPGEVAPGENVVMNVCRVVTTDNAPNGWLALGVARGDEPIEVLLPDGGVVANRDVTDAATGDAEAVEVSNATLRVVGVSVDDIDDLTARNDGKVGPIPDDEAYVLVDVEVSHTEDYEATPDLFVDWRMTSADGSRLYPFGDRDADCRRVYGFLPPGPAEDAFEFDIIFSGESKIVGACWAIPRDDLDGALLQFESSDGTNEIVTLDLGL